MKRILAGLVSLILLGTLAPAVQANETELVVMSRNIYLGADVGVAMELLPDFPAATQFMWDQMRQTDFAKRSKVLVAEVNVELPDVIGIQEATKWYCQSGLFSDQVVVFDFVEMLLNDLTTAGLNYQIATKDGQIAQNVGFEIAPIPQLTKAKDPDLFLSLFGKPEASCGFEIADVLLIKSSLASDVLAVGTTEYSEKYTIIPTLMSIYRGYSWADISINGNPVRFVTTHLESSFADNEIPVAKIQADQLVKDLAQTKIPIVLMGDFNSDPRDPRGSTSTNPGGQPSENDVCDPQVSNPNEQTALTQCNAFWTVIKGGYSSIGPDEQDPANFTWGLNALLTGPDPARELVAKQMGNLAGFTDRLDYIFIKGPVQAKSAKLIGQVQSDLWGSDHAGVVATLSLTQPIEYQEVRLAQNERFPLGFWHGVLFVLIAGFSYFLVRRTRKLKRLN